MPAASLPNVYANMSAEEKASFKRQILDGQKFSLWNKYHSRVRLQSAFAETASGYDYTFSAGTELRAFSYAIGQDMQGVGFPSGYTAQPNDTNLIKGSETISGENVLIYGLSCLLDSDTDAQLAQVVAPNVSVTVALNGDQNSYRMGNVQLVPGGGGLYGFGQSNVEVPALNASVTNISGALANGLPSADNFYAFPQPILWTASGRADSTLIVKLRVEHACTYSTTQKDRAAASGVAAWTHPTPPERGTYVGFSVHLFSRQISPRSQNS
jgi:hypothetical protein